MKASNPPKDKRTKAYKEWKAKYDNQSKGLGDTVKKVFDKTGVSKAVKFIAGEDCGCKERQTKMNTPPPIQKLKIIVSSIALQFEAMSVHHHGVQK